jgi:hypothetical protein
LRVGYSRCGKIRPIIKNYIKATLVLCVYDLKYGPELTPRLAVDSVSAALANYATLALHRQQVIY